MRRKQAGFLFDRVCPTKKHWCNAKNCLRDMGAPARLCTAATRSLTELSAFLDVSSLNLAVLRHRHLFLCNRLESQRVDPPAGCGDQLLTVLTTSAASDSINNVRSRCTAAKPDDRSNRASSI